MEDEGSFIPEIFALLSFPQKTVPNHYPQLFHIANEQSEKLSEIERPLPVYLS